MSRIIKSTFTDELAEKVSYLAKAQGMSVSSYISNLVKEQSISSDNTFEAEQEESAGKGDERISIKLSGDYAQLLKKKATEYGDTPSQYVKRLLRTGGKIYNLEINTEDIADYTAEITKISTSVNSMVRIINSTGNVVMKQDAEKMAEYLGQIKDLMSKQLKTSYSNRRQIQKSVEKKLMKDISQKG